MNAEERMQAEADMQKRLQAGTVTMGQAVREIRQRWLGIHQSEYAKMVGVSKNTLGAVERDEGAATIPTLSKILRPLGYELTMTPAKRKLRRKDNVSPAASGN
jgi:DNA-binding XRE family transcriptional regulator